MRTARAAIDDHHGRVERLVEAAILLRVADQHGAVVGLAQRLQRKRQERPHALQHEDLSLVGRDRRREPDHRREPRVAQSRGEHDALARRRCRAVVCSTKPPASGSIRVHAVIGEQRAARARDARVQRAQEPQRIAVAVERALRAAGDVGADAREPRRDAGAVEHVDAERRCLACAAHCVIRRARASSSSGDRHTCRPPGCRSATSMPVSSRSSAASARPLARRALRPRARSAACRAPCPAPR